MPSCPRSACTCRSMRMRPWPRRLCRLDSAYLPRVQVVFFHVGVLGVDDGLSEVNHGVLLLPVADDLVLLLDVDKLVAPDGRVVAFFLLSTVAKVQSALPMKRANAPEPGAAIGLRRGRASPSPYRWCTSHSTWCSHRTERRTQRGTPC